MATPDADILILDHGTIVMLLPITETGTTFLQERAFFEPWQWQSGGLCVEPRCARDIVQGAVDDGLVLQ